MKRIAADWIVLGDVAPVRDRTIVTSSDGTVTSTRYR
jgi:hypothetical protein